MSGGSRARRSLNRLPSVRIVDEDDPCSKRSAAKRPDPNDLQSLAGLAAHAAEVAKAAQAALEASNTTLKDIAVKAATTAQEAAADVDAAVKKQ